MVSISTRNNSGFSITTVRPAAEPAKAEPAAPAAEPEPESEAGDKPRRGPVWPV